MIRLRRNPTRRRHEPKGALVAAGVAAIAALLLALYVSWNASTGVPLQPSYELSVDLADAQRLVRANDVRIAGQRVGLVTEVEAIPARDDAGAAQPVARVRVKLPRSHDPIPVDSIATVRPASVLGASYLDIQLGRSKRTVPAGGLLPVRQSRPTVQLTDLLDVFERSTSADIQHGIREVGGALAGRGPDIGSAIEGLRGALPAGTAVARTLNDPRTDLDGFVANAAAMLRPLGRQAEALAGLVDDGARTFAALRRARDPLARTLETFPGAARTTTAALRRLGPAARDLAVAARALRPAADVLPSGLGTFIGFLASATVGFRALDRTAPRLQRTAETLRAFALRPEPDGAVRKLGETFTAAAPVVAGLRDAQVHCNGLGLFGETFSSLWGDLGVGHGPSMAALVLKNFGASPLEMLQNEKPLPTLHTNYTPRENAEECEAGNEPFAPGRQRLTNPAGLQARTTVRTDADPALLRQARAAGLLDDPPAAIGGSR
ncbi:MlaD family protein [Patulibacter brassicae]|uniref:MlaD family protein n=1 Tax=Patulibacter brassicae TaxID=1705717 RepID=A0ABU4VQC5_9ACTN|nr:MlaD family protein [Patulibacter brassicae]MDX8153289.1 MlaD family protein [Patulibacter brassicae]